MNKIAAFIKENRKAAGLTQEEFAARSGLGLRFIRELEQIWKPSPAERMTNSRRNCNFENCTFVK